MIEIIAKFIVISVIVFLFVDVVLYILVKQKEKRQVSNKMDSVVIDSKCSESATRSENCEHEV